VTTGPDQKLEPEDTTLVQQPGGAEFDPGGHPALPLGTKVDRYFIVEQVGRGGMGVVYKAYDPVLDRRIALKLLTGRAEEREARGNDRNRLMREAQALAQLSHPNVVAVHDVGTFGDSVFITMDFVEGKNLREWLREKRPGQEEILAVFVRVGQGLFAAHQAGLVHRDVKPENLIVGRDGRVWIVDFGLAKATEPESDPGLSQAPRLEPSAVHDRITSQDRLLVTPLTRCGAVVGTIHYMAPEQFLAVTVDERTDQFSFCVALFEALVGKRPFVGRTLGEVKKNVLTGRLQVSAQPALPTWLERILVRGLSPVPGDRYPSMAELLVDLQRDSGGRRAAARRLAMFGLAFLSLSFVLLAVLWSNHRGQLCRGAESELLGVWDAQVKEVARSAFLSTGKAFAASSWEGLRVRVDQFAADWVAMHHDACAATRLRGEQSEALLDWRMYCLELRRMELKALSEVLVRADERVVEKGVLAAQGLTHVSHCGRALSPAALSGHKPPPRDKTARKRLDEIQTAIARARALDHVGKFTEGLPVARLAVEAATKLGDRALEAEAFSCLGTLQRESGELTGSQRSFLQANWKALAAGADALVADIDTELLFLIGYVQSRPDDGLVFGYQAEAMLQRLGEGGEPKAQWHGRMGVVLQEKGEVQQALWHHQQALAISERLLARDDHALASQLHNLASLYNTLGQYDQAHALYSRVLSIWTKVLGPRHPDVGAALNNLGVLFFRKGEPDKALVYYQQALSIWEEALGKNHQDVSLVLSNLGELWATQGDPTRAIPALERALGISEKNLGPDNPDMVFSLVMLARVHERRQAWGKALPLLEQALRICQDHPCDAEVSADLRFALARLFARIPAKQNQAREQAGKALEGYRRAAGKGKEQKMVQEWLERSGLR